MRELFYKGVIIEVYVEKKEKRNIFDFVVCGESIRTMICDYDYDGDLPECYDMTAEKFQNGFIKEVVQNVESFPVIEIKKRIGEIEEMQTKYIKIIDNEDNNIFDMI